MSYLQNIFGTAAVLVSCYLCKQRHRDDGIWGESDRKLGQAAIQRVLYHLRETSISLDIN